MKKFSDRKIIDSWRKNVSPWITAVAEQQIESRKLVTDQAIIETVISLKKKTVFDIGCGEGWLARKLSSLGYNVFGVDVIPALIEEARKKSNDRFEVLAYEDISNKTVSEKFDLAICNFSLLGKESVDKLFKTIPSLLNDGGYLIIQTPHPITSCGELAYKDGWREGSWAGFSPEFSDPAPWYFRTIESWEKLFLEHNFQISQFIEPVSLQSGEINSLIMIGRLAT